MTILELTQYCLQYVEQSPDMNVKDKTLDELLEDDTLAEYMNNIEHCIYTGVVRFAESGVLPVQEVEFSSDNNVVDLNTKAHKILTIYGYDSNGNLLQDVKYLLIGKKVKLLYRQKGFSYYAVYQPMINDFASYLDDTTTSVWDIDLEDLGVPDELAILIKYLAYSELKIEDNADMANQNKNYFESYLNEAISKQIHNNQVDIKTYNTEEDLYGDYNLLDTYADES